MLRSSIRMDARLDPMTRGTVDDLARHFHQPRAAVLCHILHWGLSRELIGLLHAGWRWVSRISRARHCFFARTAGRGW
jgi:hypothetical protein